MLTIVCPIIDGHDLTKQLVDSLVNTVTNPEQFKLVLVDGDSEEKYTNVEFGELPFALEVIRHRNRGYYWPILHGYDMSTAADLVGLVHNDVIFYEKGWDQRVVDQFVQNGQLGLIGCCGSDEVDDRGGRGGGTMCNFRGVKGARTEDTGRRVTELQPALILDSMLMIFRQSAVMDTRVDADTPICHFVDKVWPLRLLQKGWRVGVLGIEIDHMGGQTAVAMPRFQAECRDWLAERHLLKTDNPGLDLYLHSEKLFLDEMRAARLVPSRMRGWNVIHA